MDKSTKFTSKAQESAYYQEYAYLKIRSSLLLILAIGSLIMTYKIGIYMGELIFPSFPVLQYIIANGFVFFAFMGIDWGLANSLSSASNKGETKQSVWFYAVSALLITITLSVVSNLVISQEMAGETDRNKFEDARNKSEALHSERKLYAENEISTAKKEQKNKIVDAKAEGNALLLKAIQSGSNSWQKDYYKHKSDKSAWFWTCTKCPKKYKTFRNRILSAEATSGLLLAEAKNHTDDIRNLYASTLSYSVKDDSTLKTIQLNIDITEKKQKAKKTDINLVLISLTLGCGILAFILTFVIKDIREGEHGQQIVEDHVKPIMIVMQISKRLITGVLNVFNSIAVRFQDWMTKKGLSKRFELSFETDNAYSNGSVATETDKKTDKKKSKRLNQKQESDKRLSVEAQNDKRLDGGSTRKCLECETDISDKRSDAKFCGTPCRMQHHNYKPPGL